jgi:hypothetical protein
VSKANGIMCNALIIAEGSLISAATSFHHQRSFICRPAPKTASLREILPSKAIEQKARGIRKIQKNRSETASERFSFF